MAFDGTSLFFFYGFGSAILFELDPDTGSILDSDSAAELGARRGTTPDLAEALPAIARSARRELRRQERPEDVWREDRRWVTGQLGDWMDTVAMARTRHLGRGPNRSHM